MATSKAAKAGIGYTVANVLIRGIGFLTLPIFSRLLDTYDFGVYNVFVAYDSVLVCVLGFAMHSSVKSANWEFPGRIDGYISCISLVYIANVAALIVLALIFGPYVSDVLGLDTAVLVVLVLHSFGAAVVSLYNARVSLQYSYKKYMVVATVNSLGNVALSLLLIFALFNGQRFMGRIFGATVVMCGLGILVIASFWRKSRPTVNRDYLRFGFRYSLPIVPHGISQVILAQFDRLMVNYMVSTIAAGIYGLAANLMIIMTVLTDSVSTVWTTWFYEAMEGESAENATTAKDLTRYDLSKKCEEVQERSGQLMRAFAVLALGLMAFAPELVWILGGDAYMDGAYCAFGMILSGFCVFLYNLIVVGEYYRQQTRWIMIATMMAAVINLVLNYVTIGRFGFIAAGYTTLVAYIIYVALHWSVCKRLLGFTIIDSKGLAVCVAILAAGCAIDLLAFDFVLVRVFAGLILCLPVTVSLVQSVDGVAGLKKLIGR